MRKNFAILMLLCLLMAVKLPAQDKYQPLQDKLVALSNGDIPQLNEKVNISVTNVAIQEFLRGVANSSGLNINVEPGLRIEVINNFSNVKVLDILMFLAKQYDLDISVIGNIITVSKAKAEPAPQPPPPPKKVLVNYDKGSGMLSIQCDNEDLINLAKEITDKTGKNIVPAPGLDKAKISGYIQNMPIDNALDKFAYANNLKIRKTDDQVYLVEKNEPAPAQTNSFPQRRGNQPGQKNQAQGEGNSNFEVKKIAGDTLYVDAQAAPIADIIKEAASQLKQDIFFTSPIQGDATFTLKKVSFPSLLEYLFRNTNYAFQTIRGIYILGDTKSREMKEFRLLQLQNRTIEKIIDVIPADLKTDLDVKEFPELNAFLVGGLPSKVNALEIFLRSIDKTVPVILIEVMFVNSQNTKNISTGIEAGLGKEPVTTTGAVYPTVDMSLGAQSVNNLINSFNGFGTVKIGHVTPNFYLKLKALETNGVIDIHSTPKLSTLNGHEATLNISNTEYYLEKQNNIYGSLSTQSSTIEVYKSVEAKLEVKIKPVVSGDDQVTLDIEVQQEAFTERISEFAPPGKTARKFKSLIRIKDQEMILLGGLEEKNISETNRGVPLLSRIPVLKWFFSSKSRSTSKSKLSIFIKPTIIN